MSPKKMVYSFGGGSADGDGSMKELLGGKGANLAEMCKIGIPVPAGFTIPTEVCVYFYKHNRAWPQGLDRQVRAALKKVEREMGRKFGDPKDPLLLSVRSGARQSMPGMMETVLNIGLTSKTIPGMIKKTGNPRFVYDAYRRLITMYSDVVMEKSAGVEVKEDCGIRIQLEELLDEAKAKRGCELDTGLTTEDLQELCEKYKKKVKQILKADFPDDPMEQLYGGINAVFASWMGKRAKDYRRLERIPDEWGTAVNVQTMVFGNMGDTSATGVAFTRDPSTGENKFYGEWLVNAQGEDVVAGIRTPSPLSNRDKTPDQKKSGVKSLQQAMPKAFKELVAIRNKLEKHYRDMQDIEFTIEDRKLWMLQCRVGKRNGTAAVRMAVEMFNEKMIKADEALMRVKPSQLDELLHPSIDPKAEKKETPITSGLPAGPGGATGQLVFSPDRAEQMAQKGTKAILARVETSPEDVAGMHAAAGILTARGGMTSHAALVARGWGKCCIVGCGEISIDYSTRVMSVGGKKYKEGEWVTLNGTTGKLYAGQLPLLPADPDKNKHYRELMKLADARRVLKVRTNADTGRDATMARNFGAQGIGLTRTEHMFFEADRIKAIRELIVSKDADQRRKAIMKLLPYQRSDFAGLFKSMKGLPVTIRLLDPPLHEFAPSEPGQIEELAHEMKITAKDLKTRIEQLHELNPMLGHRGCRLGVTYPEITEMQSRAIFEAVAQLKKKRVQVLPEVMIPLVGTLAEFEDQAAIVHAAAADVMAKKKIKFDYMVGTMIELPRAALTAGQIASGAEFFSFGTNDLTQTTFGFSRDDIGTFLPEYLDKKMLPQDPFQSIDQQGVGQLVQMGTQNGRATRRNLKVGVCGEHGGDPASVEFFHRVGLDYVSCSPFRVPIARLAAAQAAIKFSHGELTGQGGAAAPKKARKVAGKKAAKKVVKKAAKKTAKKAGKKAAKKTAKKVVKKVAKAAKKTARKATKKAATKKAARKGRRR
ncbi:pyruvate, phosphate dikinase [bacterium]|nr:pyruvate, phosphate dikinase [bacterium]